MNRRAIWIVLWALAVLPAAAGAELVLVDGQVLKGESVERKGGQYLLRLTTGNNLPVPAELVQQVKLNGDGEKPAEPEPKPELKPEPKNKTAPKTAPKAKPKSEPPKVPGGLTYAEPQTLAGPPGPVKPPELAQQLAVMRHQRSKFAPSTIDPGFTPHSDWDMSLDRVQFHPARWSTGPIDPNWSPKPAYTTESDVSAFNPARWFAAPIDATWRPTDGFPVREP